MSNSFNQKWSVMKTEDGKYKVSLKPVLFKVCINDYVGDYVIFQAPHHTEACEIATNIMKREMEDTEWVTENYPETFIHKYMEVEAIEEDKHLLPSCWIQRHGDDDYYHTIEERQVALEEQRVLVL